MIGENERIIVENSEQVVDGNDETDGTHTNKPALAKRIACYIGVEPCIFLATFSFWIYFPVFNQLVEEKVCSNLLNISNTICSNLSYYPTQQDLVQQQWATWSTYFQLIPTLFMITSALILGSNSDYFGRRIAIIMPCIGSVCGMIHLIVLCSLRAYSVYNFFLTSVLNGMFGGLTVHLMAAFAYVSDITTDGRSRTIRISIIEGINSLAGGVAGFAGAWIISDYNYVVVFYVVLIANVLNILYAGFVLPESRPFDGGVRRPWYKELRRIFNMKHLYSGFLIFNKPRPASNRFFLTLFIILFSIILGQFFGDFSINQQFTEFPPLNWSLEKYLNIQSVLVLVQCITLLVILPISRRLLNLNDLIIAAIVSVLKILAAYLASISTTDALMLASLSISTTALAGPVILRSLASKLVGAEEQGRLFSLICVIECVIPIATKLLYSQIFAATLTWWPGFVFVVSCVLGLITLPWFFYADLALRNKTLLLDTYVKE